MQIDGWTPLISLHEEHVIDLLKDFYRFFLGGGWVGEDEDVMQ